MTLATLVTAITGAVTDLVSDFGVFIGAGVVLGAASRVFSRFIKAGR